MSPIAEPPAPRHASNAFDQRSAENAVGPDHHDEDHQDVGREVLRAAADIGVEIAGGQILDHAHDQSADDGADHRVEAAQDDDRKHLETNERELVIDPQHGAPDDA